MIYNKIITLLFDEKLNHNPVITEVALDFEKVMCQKKIYKDLRMNIVFSYIEDDKSTEIKVKLTDEEKIKLYRGMKLETNGDFYQLDLSEWNEDLDKLYSELQDSHINLAIGEQFFDEIRLYGYRVFVDIIFRTGEYVYSTSN